jgi:hypothetical protein
MPRQARTEQQKENRRASKPSDVSFSDVVLKGVCLTFFILNIPLYVLSFMCDVIISHTTINQSINHSNSTYYTTETNAQKETKLTFKSTSQGTRPETNQAKPNSQRIEVGLV